MGKNLTDIYSLIKILTVLIPFSPLTTEQKALFNKFIENTVSAIDSLNYTIDLDALFDLQNRNFQLERINQQLKTKAERLRKLYDLSIRDGLTQLYNQVHFYNTIQYEFMRFHRYQRERLISSQKGLALLIAGVDDLRYYNEMNGYSEGDLVLKLIARIMTQRLRATDFIARYGGDKIVIILHEITPADAFKVAECLRERVENYPFPGENSQPRKRLTISIGVSHMINDYTTKEEFIQAAEERLSEAKISGKNQVRTDFLLSTVQS